MKHCISRAELCRKQFYKLSNCEPMKCPCFLNLGNWGGQIPRLDTQCHEDIVVFNYDLFSIFLSFD